MDTTYNKHSHEFQMEYGGFGLRVLAYVIDVIIIGIPLVIITLFLFSIYLGSSGIFNMFMTDPAIEIQITDAEAAQFLFSYLAYLFLITIISVCVAVAYFAGFHSSKWQATIGKKIVGLKVTDIAGNRISFWRGTGRYFAMSCLSGIFLIGYLMVLFTEKKQALHDLLASTVVIKEK